MKVPAQAFVRRSLAAAAVVMLLAAQGASAQTKPNSATWTERPYNPPVGSRWTIATQSDAKESRAAGDTRSRQIRTRAEFTIEEKLADGFRITYVNRGVEIGGNAPGLELAAQAFSAMKDIVIRARTDATGKPLAVENIDEVKTTMRAVVDRMVKGFDANPQAAAFMQQLMGSFLLVDGAQAATTYMEDLPVLAAGQNTKLAPGAVKRESESVPSPLGGGEIKSSLETRLVSWDDATGKARLVRSRSLDPEALKQATLDLTQKLSAAIPNGSITPEMLTMMKNVSLSITSEVTMDVDNGMTRAIEDRSTTTASLMGQTFSKEETKVVTVTSLAK